MSTRIFRSDLHFRLLTLASLPLLGMAAGQVSAQNSQEAPAPQEILISERSLENTLPLELARYGADLEIVTEEQIRNHGFVDVAQSLEMLVPGLHLTTQ